MWLHFPVNLNHCANISTYTQSIMIVLRLSPCDDEDSFVPRDGPGKVIRIPKVVVVCLVDEGTTDPVLREEVILTVPLGDTDSDGS